MFVMIYCYIVRFITVKKLGIENTSRSAPESDTPDPPERVDVDYQTDLTGYMILMILYRKTL